MHSKVTLQACKMSPLTLSQTTNFRLFQVERVCRRQFNFVENGRKFFKKVENTVGKGEIARANSPFHTVFSKYLYCRPVKTSACLFGKRVNCIDTISYATCG